MKPSLTSRLFLLASSLAAANHASAVPIPWIPVVDNAFTPALTSHPAPVPLTRYLSFDPPIMPQYDGKLLAYKARLRLGLAATGVTITAANDEGVWGNGPEYSQTGTFSLNPTLILQEGNPTGTASSGITYGNAGSLIINNLQMTLRGDTVFQSNVSTGGKANLHDNCCLQIMGQSGATAPFLDLGPPVVDLWGPNVANWFARNPVSTPIKSGIMRLTYPTGFMLPPCTPFTASLASFTGSSSAVGAMAAIGGVGNFLATPSPIGSPAISERGHVLFYAWDQKLPTIKRQHLRMSLAGGGEVILNRRDDLVPFGDLYYPLGKLGVYAPKLVCMSDRAGTPSLAAWQMSSMINSSSVTVTAPSLWIQRLLGANVPECIITQGVAAPGTTSTFNTFYEMQTVTDMTGAGDHWVFFGTNLLNGKRAIYVVKVPVAGPFSAPILIATDDTPVGTFVTGVVGGTQRITTLQPWFNVSIRGEVAFIANVAAFPVGAKQVLCTALAATPAPVVRSQTSLIITTLTGSGFITGFDLAKPDQGVFSRGQAINGLGNIAARILFRQQTTAGISNFEGIFFAP